MKRSSMLKTGVLGLAFTMAIGFSEMPAAAFASPIATTASIAPAALPAPLTLEAISALALEQSVAIDQAESLVAVKEAALLAAIEDQFMHVASLVETRKNESWYIRQAGMQLDAAKWALKELCEETVIAAHAQARELLLARHEIKLQESRIARVGALRSDVEKKVALGREPASALGKAETALSQEISVLQRLRLSETILTHELNHLLNRGSDEALPLVETQIPYEPRLEVAWPLLLKAMTLSNGELSELDDKVILLKLERDIYDDLNDEGDHDHTLADIREQIRLAEWERLNRERALAYALQSEWLALQMAGDSCMLQELTIADLKDGLYAAEKRLAVGMGTQSEVSLMKEQLDFALLELDRLHLAYAVDAETFESHLK